MSTWCRLWCSRIDVVCQEIELHLAAWMEIQIQKEIHAATRDVWDDSMSEILQPYLLQAPLCTRSLPSLPSHEPHSAGHWRTRLHHALLSVKDNHHCSRCLNISAIRRILLNPVSQTQDASVSHDRWFGECIDRDVHATPTACLLKFLVLVNNFIIDHTATRVSKLHRQDLDTCIKCWITVLYTFAKRSNPPMSSHTWHCTKQCQQLNKQFRTTSNSRRRRSVVFSLQNTYHTWPWWLQLPMRLQWCQITTRRRVWREPSLDSSRRWWCMRHRWWKLEPEELVSLYGTVD